MCSIIILAVFGFFAFFGIRSSATVGTIDPVVATIAEMTPTPTPQLFALTENTPIPAAVPDTVIECVSPIPPEADKLLVETFRSDVLNAANGWTFTFDDTQPFRTTGTWLNGDLNAVAYLDLLHYDCGLMPNAVEQYFTPENQAILLSNYDSYQLVSYCNRAEQSHYIFETSDNGVDYETRYWLQTVQPSRMIVFLFTTPVSRAADVAPLLEELFPALPNCRNAGAG